MSGDGVGKLSTVNPTTGKPSGASSHEKSTSGSRRKEGSQASPPASAPPTATLTIIVSVMSAATSPRTRRATRVTAASSAATMCTVPPRWRRNQGPVVPSATSGNHRGVTFSSMACPDRDTVSVNGRRTSSHQVVRQPANAAAALGGADRSSRAPRSSATCSTRSPVRRPARSAGPPGITSATWESSGRDRSGGRVSRSDCGIGQRPGDRAGPQGEAGTGRKGRRARDEHLDADIERRQHDGDPDRGREGRRRVRGAGVHVTPPRRPAPRRRRAPAAPRVARRRSRAGAPAAPGAAPDGPWPP